MSDTDRPSDPESSDPPAKRPGTPRTTRPARAAKSPRRRSRELALQGLYEWQVSKSGVRTVASHMREQEDFARSDAEHFDALLEGCIAQVEAIDAVIARHADRPTKQLSPIEHGALMIGVYELMHCLDVPYRVVINEGVELAKAFGGTDGHKFVNGVLDKAAAQLRPEEVAAAPPRRARDPRPAP